MIEYFFRLLLSILLLAFIFFFILGYHIQFTLGLNRGFIYFGFQHFLIEVRYCHASAQTRIAAIFFVHQLDLVKFPSRSINLINILLHFLQRVLLGRVFPIHQGFESLLMIRFLLCCFHCCRSDIEAAFNVLLPHLVAVMLHLMDWLTFLRKKISVAFVFE